MAAILSDTYTCKVQGLLYTYDVLWDSNASGMVSWEANVSCDHRLATFRGIVPAAEHDDPAELVRAKVHERIEDYSERQSGQRAVRLQP